MPIKTPFMKPLTDGKTDHFWTIEISGYISNAIDQTKFQESIKNLDFKIYHTFNQYHMIVMLCNEEILHDFDDYLSELNSTHFKIVGLYPAKRDQIKHIVDTMAHTSKRWENEFLTVQFL